MPDNILNTTNTVSIDENTSITSLSSYQQTREFIQRNPNIPDSDYRSAVADYNSRNTYLNFSAYNRLNRSQEPEESLQVGTSSENGYMVQFNRENGITERIPIDSTIRGTLNQSTVIIDDLSSPSFEISSSPITYISNSIGVKLYEIRESLNSMQINYITIAGGAPRDIYFNSFDMKHSKSVKDFDIYVMNLSDDPIEVSELEAFGFTNVTLLGVEDYQNDGEPISQVIYAKYKGLEVNLVVYGQEITKEEIIDNFSCSLSKFELDIDRNLVIPHKEALLSISSKTLIFKPETRDSYKHKIKSYFSAYRTGTYQDAVLSILDRELSKLESQTSAG